MVHQRLPDIRALNVLEVYQLLAKYTTWQATPEELKARGWEPYLQAGLVGVSTAGYLVWTGGSSGQRLNLDQHNDEYVVGTMYASQSGLGIGTHPAGSTAINYRTHKLASYGVALVAGAKADQELLAAIASYKGRILIRSIMSDTNIAAGFTAHFEDSTPTDCSGLPGGTIIFGALTAYVPTQLNPPILVYNLTANKNIRVDYTNGAGVEYIVLQYETWLEA